MVVLVVLGSPTCCSSVIWLVCWATVTFIIGWHCHAYSYAIFCGGSSLPLFYCVSRFSCWCDVLCVQVWRRGGPIVGSSFYFLIMFFFCRSSPLCICFFIFMYVMWPMLPMFMCSIVEGLWPSLWYFYVFRISTLCIVFIFHVFNVG